MADVALNLDSRNIYGEYRANEMNWTELNGTQLPARSVSTVRATQLNWTEISAQFSSVYLCRFVDAFKIGGPAADRNLWCPHTGEAFPQYYLRQSAWDYVHVYVLGCRY